MVYAQNRSRIMESCDVMPGTKATRNSNAGPRTGMWRHSSDRSVTQTETHARVPRPPACAPAAAHHIGPTPGHWGRWGRQLRIVLDMQPWSSTPHRKGPAGGRFQGPGPASPDRVRWHDGAASTASAPSASSNSGVCVAGSFPRTVPCLSRGAKFIRGYSQPPELQLPKLARLQLKRTQLPRTRLRVLVPIDFLKELRTSYEGR